MRRDRKRDFTVAQKMLAMSGPMKSRLMRDGLSLAEAEEGVDLWRDWNREHGLQWRCWHSYPHSIDLIRLDLMSRGLPDPGAQAVTEDPNLARTNVLIIQSRLDQIFDALPELFEGVPPEDPPGFWKV